MDNNSSTRKNSKLSIVHVNLNEGCGGASKVATLLAESQRSAGHNALMLVGSKSSGAPYTTDFRTIGDPFIEERFTRQGLLDYHFLGSHRLNEHPYIQSADIVHLHNLHGGYFNPFSIVLLSNFRPTLWTLHDMQALTGHCAHSLDCEKWKHGCGGCPDLERYPAIRCDSTARLWNDKKWIYDNSRLRIVAPSQWLKGKVEESMLRDHQAEKIYNGVDISVFRPFDRLIARRKFGLPEDCFIMGGSATGGVFANPWKGGNYAKAVITEVGKRVKKCLFVNIGAGAESRSYEPNVIDIPWLKDESELSQLYSSLDAFLLTSIAENCPLVVLEVMACGVPVVSFDTGGVPELVRHGRDGFVFKFNDTRSLSEAMIRLAEDKNLQEVLGKSARKRVEGQFDIRSIAEQYEQTYEEVVGQWKSDKKASFSFQSIPEIVNSEPFRCFRTELEKFQADTPPEVHASDAQSSVGDEKPAERCNQYLVSAIVSAYNSERFLCGCLEDLESQSIADKTEIIVVDSGSEQDEESIVKDFQKNYSNIKYIRTEQRETVYGAWNRAIMAARGKYITNANSDDRHRKDAFEVMAGVLEMRPEIALVYADVIKTDTENATFNCHNNIGIYNWHDWDRDVLIKSGCFIGPQPMWRRSVHDVYGYFDDSFVSSGDYEFWLRISQTYEFYHIRMPLGLYLENSNSLEHRSKEIKLIEDLKIQRCYLEAKNKGIIINELSREGLLKDEILCHINQKTKKGDRQMTFLTERNDNLPNNDWTHLRNASPESGFGMASHKTSPDKATAEEIHRCLQPVIGNGNNRVSVWILQKLIESFPDFPEGYNDLGVLYYNMGEKEKAQLYYERASKLQPENITIIKNLADFYFAELGRIDDAVEIYKKVLKLSPNDVETLLITGHLCVALTQFNDARLFYKRVLEIEPWNSDAKNNLDFIDGKLRNSIEEDRHTEGVCGKITENIEIRQAGIGQVTMHDDYNLSSSGGCNYDAIKSLESLIRQCPENAIAHNDLGVLYYNSGDKDKALGLYEDALRLEPENLTFQKNLADFYFVESGRAEDAMRIYLNILSTHPSDLETLTNIGHLCVAHDQLDSARVFFSRALDIEPWNEDARKCLEMISGDNAAV